MTRRTRLTILVSIAAYLFIGSLFGLVMSSAIPAMNGYGVAYYAVTWPGQVYDGATHSHIMPVPAWCFTFTDQAQ